MKGGRRQGNPPKTTTTTKTTTQKTKQKQKQKQNKNKQQPKNEKEVERHQGMDRRGIRQVPEGGGEQRKMEETGCEIICGTPTTLLLRDR